MTLETLELRFSMKKSSVLLVLSLSVLVFAGCGSGMVGLKGTVVFSDDGSPLTAGMICFETDTYVSRGMIGPDGTFVLGSLKTDDGIPPGTYRVFIDRAQQHVGKRGDGEDVYEPMIDPKYADGRTSGITVEVTPSMKKQIEIKVDRYVKK